MTPGFILWNIWKEQKFQGKAREMEKVLKQIAENIRDQSQQKSGGRRTRK
jgi:hypothetical protein